MTSVIAPDSKRFKFSYPRSLAIHLLQRGESKGERPRRTGRRVHGSGRTKRQGPGMGHRPRKRLTEEALTHAATGSRTGVRFTVSIRLCMFPVF